MQMAAPEGCFNVDSEPETIKQLYGLDNPKCTHFSRQCLIARRMIERGVRFVQIYSGGTENEKSWDGHTNIGDNHRQFAGETDVPIAGLLSDLKQRGLLDSTLVVWNGEFGRLPLVQKGGTGRDHNPHAFTTWMAGAGVKGGVHHGDTDDFGHKAISGRVSINDLHATMLHLMGIDHTRLTYHFNGRDFRLTDVAGEVVREILALKRCARRVNQLCGSRQHTSAITLPNQQASASRQGCPRREFLWNLGGGFGGAYRAQRHNY